MAKIKIATSDTIPEYRGYMFNCPGCQEIHVPNQAWGFNNNLDKPTLTSSILVNGTERSKARGRKRCHSFVKDGMIQFLDDCDHALAGQTVELPDWPEHDKEVN